MASPYSSSKSFVNVLKNKTAAKDLANRVKKCWELDIDWSLIPSKLKVVSLFYKIINKRLIPNNKILRLVNKLGRL